MNLTLKNTLPLVLAVLCQFAHWQSAEAQNVSYVPLNTSSTINNKSINTLLPSGATPGEAFVTDNGGTTYDVPIAVPPGTNGMAPELSVAYNSMSGNSSMGRGWNIMGLSSITRGGQSFHFDGDKTAVNMTSSDRFFLDGARLTLRSGSYGSSGSTYRKEVDDFSTLTAYGNMGGSPQYFKLEMKDGTVMEYGNSSDSRFLNQTNNEVLIWRINRIIYKDGNYIQFYWTSGYRDNRIYEIKYTGNTVTGQAPYNLIRFHYKTRMDQNTVYEAGSSILNRYLLDRIEVKSENSTVKNYYFRYSFDGYRSLLNSIQEKGSDGTALNSTIFKYGNQPVDFSTQNITSFQGQACDLFSGDFDGDGYTDILTAPYAYQNSIKYNTGLRVYKRTSTNGSYTLSYLTNLPAGSTVINDLNVPDYHSFSTSDFTGDGRDDIMTMKITITGSQSWRTLNYLRLYESTGTSFSPSYHFPPANFNVIAPGFKYFYPGDFNGDGITDFILFLSNKTGYRAFMTLGGTNIKNVEISGIGAGPYYGSEWAFADDVRVLDFDGDGKMELMKIKDASAQIYTFNQNGNSISGQLLYNSGFPTKWHRIYLGDFNGDRKTDMLVRNSQTSNSGNWEKALSTGKNFAVSNFTFNRTPDVTGTYSDDKLIIGDFNGDGRTDIMHGWSYSTTSTLGLYFSRGNNFQYETENFNGLLSFSPLVQYDLNGDGRADLLNRVSTNSPATVFYFQKEGQDLLMQNVVDGHLKRTNFLYRRMTQTSNFYTRQPSSTYPENRVSIPIYLAYQMQKDNGIGGYFTTQYKYENAYVHRAGKGFMGFEEFHTIDLTNNVRTESQRMKGPGTYIMAPFEIRKYVNSTNYLFHKTSYDRTFVSRPNESYWIRINNVTENLLLQGQTKTASFAYDSYGNVLQEIENNGVEITTISTSYGQYGGPIPNRPLIMHVNRQRAGQIPHYFTQRNYYNSIGQLTSKVDFYGYPKAVTTSFAYNNLGNVIVKTISSSGLSPRQTTKSYDSRGRFVVGMTNPMGYGESATYDNKWGKKLSVTGIDGLTTTFQYDVFGRRTRTTLPTGVVINEYYPFFVSSTFGSTYCHNITQVGKPDQWHYFDKLGRKVRHHRKTYNNDTVQEIWTFDTRGRLKTVRAPYKSGETTFTTTLNYDTYNRRTSESNPFGTTTYSYSFSGGKSKITKTNAAGQVTTVEMDASGVRTKATDNGGTLNYVHDSQGQIKEVKLGNTVMATVTHDPYGNKVQVIDKNAGTISYAYNAYKELTSQTNANGHTYYMAYNNLGQIIRRNGPGEDRRYFYYGSGVAKGKVYYVYNILSADREYYYYDSYGRVRQKLERIDGPYLSTRLTYNNYNDVTSKTYPSGLKLDYSYDSNGFLTTIKHLATNHTLFTTQAMNGREQYTSYKLGNNKTTAITYNQGVPTRYRSTGIQDLIMSWNYTNGNLNYRYDAIKARYESFTYDNLNRLKTAQVSGQPTKSVNYAANGNITSKTDVGNYYYPPGKNNAVIRVSNSSSTIPTVTQDISYTQFDQPSKVSEGNFELDYTYGQDRQRIKSVLKENGVTKAIRLYLGDFERQTKQGAVKDIHYVDAGQGTVAMVVKYNGVYQFYYTYTDHLGSILRVTDANATTVAEQNFDAWGRKRNASTWTYANVNSVPDWLYRGYTSHEEMPEFDLINMNGRLYDPIVGRMLAVDNHVQSPNSTQNYNRYTYALNNPLSYTDPSGEVLWYVPVIVGAVVGAYAGASIASGSWNFTNWTSAAWKGAIVGAFVGAAAGAMFAAAIGASGITTGAAATGTVQTATQAGAAVGASLAPGTGAATVGASASTTAAAATGKSLTAAWSITTSALKGANIKMAVTAVTGGDLDKIYKAGLVGAALGGYKGVFDVTKGFGLADSWGWKLTLLNKAVYTGLESIGGNWINGDPLFYGFILEVGPARFSFGKKYEGEPIWRWQDNIGSLLPEAITLLGWAAGGTPGYDLDKLTLTSTGGWFSTLPELNKIDKTIVPSGKDWISFIGQIFSKLGAS